uniref:Uncharacterized protein n=1 Tax=viral metagenome TaxID=1070528 RepID=A0A2V0RNA1_9ZZZZ
MMCYNFMVDMDPWIVLNDPKDEKGYIKIDEESFSTVEQLQRSGDGKSLESVRSWIDQRACAYSLHYRELFSDVLRGKNCAPSVNGIGIERAALEYCNILASIMRWKIENWLLGMLKVLAEGKGASIITRENIVMESERSTFNGLTIIAPGWIDSTRYINITTGHESLSVDGVPIRDVETRGLVVNGLMMFPSDADNANLQDDATEVVSEMRLTPNIINSCRRRVMTITSGRDNDPGAFGALSEATAGMVKNQLESADDCVVKSVPLFPNEAIVAHRISSGYEATGLWVQRPEGGATPVTQYQSPDCNRASQWDYMKEHNVDTYYAALRCAIVNATKGIEMVREHTITGDQADIPDLFDAAHTYCVGEFGLAGFSRGLENLLTRLDSGETGGVTCMDWPHELGHAIGF